MSTLSRAKGKSIRNSPALLYPASPQTDLADFPKLKCSRELPRCARCLKFDITCTYPTPPDRKMLAALRAPPEKRRSGHHPSSPKRRPRDYPSQQSHRITPPTYSIPLHGEQAPVDDLMATLDFDLSAEVRDLLQEIYFTCQFHASMLFHRPTFLRAFETGQVPSHVLLALYSSATMLVYPNIAG